MNGEIYPIIHSVDNHEYGRVLAIEFANGMFVHAEEIEDDGGMGYYIYLEDLISQEQLPAMMIALNVADETLRKWKEESSKAKARKVDGDD